MSRSHNAHWWLAWLSAVILCALATWGFEHYWRAKGYVASIIDSQELWAQQRAAVSDRDEKRVALLGASRIQFGIAPHVFEDEAEKLGRPVHAHMLAINGHYPLAALRDLAKDASFRGIALVGVDSRGLQKIHREMQSRWTHYYNNEWTPARDLHRTLLTELQRHFIAARSDFSWSNLIVRELNGWGPPQKEYVTFFADRSGLTEYGRADVAAIRDARIRDLKSYYESTPAISPSQWLQDNVDVIAWVKQINARGGSVVFYREPISGEHLALDEARFPRADFWDAFAKQAPATFIDFRDYAALMIDTPDTSHIDARDVDRHTWALVRLLVEKKVLR